MHSSGSVWESRQPSWAVRPNKHYDFHRCKGYTESWFGTGLILSLICVSQHPWTLSNTTELNRECVFLIIGWSCSWLLCDAFFYHWCELPQIIIFFHYKTHLLLRQKYACRDKTFVVTELCLSWQNIFVATKLLSWQIFFCNKHMFCRNKSFVVVPKVLLRQKWYLWQLLPTIVSVGF